MVYQNTYPHYRYDTQYKYISATSDLITCVVKS